MTQFQDNSLTPPRIFEVDQSVTFTQDTAGIYHFFRDGVNLNWPTTFVPYIAPPPPPPTLQEVKNSQISTIRMACSTAITSGFTSSALGSAYTYPSNVTDQANLNANVVSSLLPNLPTTWTTEQLCADSTGVWAYRAHTAAQIQQVGSDGKSATMACLLKNGALTMQIDAATTVSAVQSITW